MYMIVKVYLYASVSTLTPDPYHKDAAVQFLDG